MILIDNRNVLRFKDRELLQRLSKWDDQPASGTVFSEPARTGALTIKVLHDGKPLYLQSKYDPQKEAQRFAGKFDGEVIKHVLFAGIGTGAHIEAFMEKHPNAKFSIYEPNEELLHMYLSNFRLDELPIRQLEKIFTGTKEETVMFEVQQLLAASNNVLKIITLPVYEKIYGEQIQIIFQKALESVKDRHSVLATNVAFQKRWTINSIKNFPTVLQTPNILRDINRSAFEGKPAIIVAAGPSLNEEFENLRYIKEHGLAYIFSVGSAINALIEQGIYPDVACTYDPSERNQKVFEKLKEKNIPEIPLIFGSSVGFETLENYPGSMFHMITSQDSVSPKLLDTAQSIDIVFDAPSIAVVTLQLLAKLGANPVILAGQNLGYLQNHRYAKGIRYDFVENELNEEEQEKSLKIKDVEGNEIESSDDFNRMRSQLEMYIASNPSVKVINTTKKGAHIEGAEYMVLKEVIETFFSEKQVIDFFSSVTNCYDVTFIKKRSALLADMASSIRKEIQILLNELEQIQLAKEQRRFRNIEKQFAAFDQLFNRLKQNEYYQGFLEPLVRVQNEELSLKVKDIRYEENVEKKANTVVNSFGRYLHEVAIHHDFVLPYFEEMKSEIDSMNGEDTI
ncbi:MULTISPECIES: motility associated factor glycosyltransferase family protein [Sporosarcina]|uniref:Uncharacterized conserved protein n=1 Tax=Sporosarcina newyorkensis TaxID=759851 RepID=A0A1T4Y304_9BACL|nr:MULTISPECIES: 6-hydroxymethylpterin diphosphokinase MptE-like protein [Sporosarcina]MBY0223494.1 motility associated factor glycosyltransferase family protein [Sporosarcina aquimarina]SKA95665.1 Uncharacterized conserved protein [Sporosarcina newyorkensis]